MKCPICGSPAILDSTGTSECYGKGWQVVLIECNKERDPYCGMTLELYADFEYLNYSDSKLIEFWEGLNKWQTL